jgi:hypothetical protein
VSELVRRYIFILFYMPLLTSIIEHCAKITSNPVLYAIEISAGTLTCLDSYVRGPARRHPARFDNLSHDIRLFPSHATDNRDMTTQYSEKLLQSSTLCIFPTFCYLLPRDSSSLSSQSEIWLRDGDCAKISCGSVEIIHAR